MRALSVRELIIEVQQQVQRLGSFKRDKTSESNIVWALNTAQERFIKERVKPNPNQPDRFMIDEKSRTDLQAIITTDKALSTYRTETYRAFSYLPEDHAYLINDRSMVLPDCNEQFAAPTEPANYLLSIISFADTSKAATPFYATVQVNCVGQTSSIKNYNLLSKKEKFEIVGAVIEQFQSLGLVVYWERFHTTYKPDSFIVVQPVISGSSTPTVDLVVDGTTASKTTTTLALVKFKSFVGSSFPNRSLKGDFLYDAITNDYYSQPFPDSPVSQLADNRLLVYSSKRFLVSGLIIDYIRKPRRISLYLNQDCELDGSVHKEICSIASEILLGEVEAANYPAKVQENLNRLE